MRHAARDINLMVVHQSASHRFVTAAEINRWHLARFKLGIGYHRVVEADGFVMDGRKIQRQGAHAPPNKNRLGICVVGWNGNSAHPEWAWTERQWVSLMDELMHWCDRLPDMRICGHNQTKATECPGVNLRLELIDRGWPEPDRLVRGAL